MTGMGGRGVPGFKISPNQAAECKGCQETRKGREQLGRATAATSTAYNKIGGSDFLNGTLRGYGEGQFSEERQSEHGSVKDHCQP
ncbi:hypothetical protein HaLaN_29099 [Haematococcus lacustris]|uniref:Uncharacterized protein n=1 Tax=Haematococcus lacustris TaxID=44745 RepID=A0A6A0AC65_HAELA|nr:hypothetical protein HaLaN_29099 [Haematococcus lacustris]